MLLLKVNEHLMAAVKVLHEVEELSEADEESTDKEEVLVKPCR